MANIYKNYNDSESEKSRIFLDDGTQRSGMKIQQLLSVCENERERYLLHTSGILFAQRAILLRNACDTRLRDRGYYDRDDVHSFANGNLLVFLFSFFFCFLEGRVDTRVGKEKKRKRERR